MPLTPDHRPLRVDTSNLAPDPLRAAVEWVRSLGLAPDDLASIFAIVRTQEGRWELHVTEHLRNDAGHKYLDQAKQDIVSRPVVIDLGTEASWPEFTGGEIL